MYIVTLKVLIFRETMTRDDEYFINAPLTSDLSP